MDALENKDYSLMKDFFKTVSDSVAKRENMFESDIALDAKRLIEKSGSPSFGIIHDLTSLILKKIDSELFAGLGVDVGAGLGVLSSSLLAMDRNNIIEGIIALEGCRPYVDFGIKQVAKELIPARSKHLIPFFDSFEESRVQDSTFDFAIQIESLHHAENPTKALEEVFRILKPGSFFLSIDRSWPNEVSQQVLQSLLDHEYSQAWKEAKGLDIDKVFTRRENGEHEYRDFEWENFFKQGGFQIFQIIHLHPIIQPWEIVKIVCCKIGLRKALGIQIEPRRGLFLSSLAFKLKLNYKNKYGTLVSPHPRPLTMILAKKPS